LRILFVNDEPFAAGGKEKYLCALGASLREAGHVTGLIHTRPPRREAASLRNRESILFFIPGLETYRGTSKTIQRIKECTELFKPDLIHIHHNARNLVAVAWLLSHFPVLRSIHDVEFLCPLRYYIRTRTNRVCDVASGRTCLTGGCLSPLRVSSWARLIQTNLSQRIFRQWGRLNTQSHFIETGLLRIGFRPDAMEVLPVFAAEADGTEAGRLNENKKFLFVGRLHPLKGPQIAIEAIKLLGDARMEIIGAGGMEAPLKAIIQETGLAGRITFTGYLDGTELRSRYRSALAVVVPGTIPENCPMVIQEAMAAGIPVIATNVGGIPELVVDGETGFLVPPNDPHALGARMQQLLDNPDLAVRLGTNGRRKIHEEKFRPAYHLTQLLGEYRTTIDKFRPIR
jgi:glycosyltransferase involved in cell wall biosynthesis